MGNIDMYMCKKNFIPQAFVPDSSRFKPSSTARTSRTRTLNSASASRLHLHLTNLLHALPKEHDVELNKPPPKLVYDRRDYSEESEVWGYQVVGECRAGDEGGWFWFLVLIRGVGIAGGGGWSGGEGRRWSGVGVGIVIIIIIIAVWDGGWTEGC